MVARKARMVTTAYLGRREGRETPSIVDPLAPLFTPSDETFWKRLPPPSLPPSFPFLPPFLPPSLPTCSGVPGTWPSSPCSSSSPPRSSRPRPEGGREGGREGGEEGEIESQMEKEFPQSGFLEAFASDGGGGERNRGREGGREGGVTWFAARAQRRALSLKSSSLREASATPPMIGRRER